MTAAIRLDGEEGRVLEQAARLLRLVERLDGARLLSLRIEYDPEAGPAHIVDCTCDPFFEGGDGGTPSPREAELWRLALRAATTTDRPAIPG